MTKMSDKRSLPGQRPQGDSHTGRQTRTHPFPDGLIELEHIVCVLETKAVLVPGVDPEKEPPTEA